jgi:hypothetical protein
MKKIWMCGACSTYGGQDRFLLLGVDRWIILKCVYKKWDGAWTGLIWPRIKIDGERV